MITRYAVLILLFFNFPLQSATLNLSCDAEPSAMNIHTANDVQTFSVLRDLYETLLELTPEGTLTPAAAHSFKVSKDKKTYIFKLRKESKWSNGDPVTAHDFVYSFRKIVDPKKSSPYANHLYIVKNAEDIIKGKLGPDTLGVKALDDYHFQITLTAPAHHFLYLLSHPSFAPLHIKSHQMHPTFFSQPGKLISNGAFKLEEWQPGESLLLVRNVFYRNHKHVKLDAVRYVPIAGEAQYKAYQKGTIDVAINIPDTKIKDVNQGPLFKEKVQSPLFGMTYLGFNTRTPPFDNLKVRQALALVIDRTILTSHLLHEGEQPLYRWNLSLKKHTKRTFPKELKKKIAVRSAEGKKLLKEAGYGPDNPLSFDILTVDLPSHQRILRAIIEMWNKNLDISPKMIFVDQKHYASEIGRKEFQAYLGGLFGLYNDPHSFAELMSSKSGFNFVDFNDPPYDMLIKNAALETNLKKRTKLYREADKILWHKKPVIPLATKTTKKLVKPYVKGVKPNIMDVYYAKQIWLER